MRAFWRGFTLAEVLITLTIIGIIAALTIPSLMTKVQDHSYRSGLLKAYSTLQNAHKLALRNGETLSGIWKRDNTKKYDTIKEYFKVAKGPYWATDGVACTRGVGRLYSDDISYFENNVKQLNGASAKALLCDSGMLIAFQQPDSTIISFFTAHSMWDEIMVDVNGAKPPNTIGKDIFIFSVLDDRIIPVGTPYDSSYMRSSYNITLGNIVSHNIKKGCMYTNEKIEHKRGIGSGITCAYFILKDKSFKIPKE